MQTAITRTSGPGRVLLVDDHPAVRRVLRSLLEEVGGWQVVGEADSGEAAIPLVEQLAPDVVLMDCRMPGAGGVAATREIVNRWPEVAVVAHTAYADETYVREMVAAGARGYVLKGDVPAAVLEALSAARQGQARLSAAVTGPVMEDLRELYEAAVSRSKELEAENADLSSTVARLEEVDLERTYHHARTFPLDPETGQVAGDRVHVAYICAAMRVVAEVDVELGLSRVVWIGAAQDIGKAINPQAVHGQIEGGTAQGLGLALMEEIQTRDGLITNASFTDYLIPTTLDMPVIDAELVEDPEPDAPYGAKGVGEPPTVVSTAAVVSALRAASGRELSRVPVRPDDLAGL